MQRMCFSNRFSTLMYRTATHLYLAPHPSLRPYVAHYTYCLPHPEHCAGGGSRHWRDPDSPPPLVLIPDASGCLVFTLLPSGPRGVLYGPTTQAVTVHNDLGVGPPRFFVEFRPGGLFAFTGIPQWELSDRTWPLEDAAPELYVMACGAFSQASDLDDFAARMDAALLARDPVPSPVLPLLGSKCLSSQQALAASSGYSSRHLSRLFREGAGMGCKAYFQVLRVNAAIRALQAGPPSLTRLAQELGYFDQSHFIHEFKSVCGVSPGRYLAHMSGFYNEPLKP